MPRFAHRVAILCIAAVTCAAAGNDPWIRISSANFDLYTTAGERSGRDLIRHFEQVRGFFVQAFGSGLANARPVRVVAFRNEKEYEPYRPNEFSTAFFQPGESNDFIVMSSASRDRYPVAVHEFTHLMVHQGGEQYPPWLNEGLAELFSNLQPVGNKIKVGQDLPGRLIALRTEPWIPLATLLAVDRTSPYYNERSKAGMFYAESWELVHMLFLHPDYAPRLKAMSAALKRGGAQAAFREAYNKTIPEIESDLHTYMRGDTIKVFLFDIQLSKSVDTPEIANTAGIGARLTLAELLANSNGRSEQAQAAYESLAKDYPDRWEVEEGWGQWAWRRRRLDEAAHHYARAVELGARDWRLFLAYGRVLAYSNRVNEAAGALGKAARLNPDSDDIHLELGAVYVRAGDYAAALAQLQEVKKYEPAQAYRYFYNRAFAEYRVGQTADARNHASKARTYARSPEERASLDRLDQALGAHPSIEGALESLECGKPAQLHVRVDGAVRTFAMPDLHAVAVRTAGGEPVTLQCGQQHPAPAVRIEYGADGAVRSLEFK